MNNKRAFNKRLQSGVCLVFAIFSELAADILLTRVSETPTVGGTCHNLLMLQRAVSTRLALNSETGWGRHSASRHRSEGLCWGLGRVFTMAAVVPPRGG